MHGVGTTGKKWQGMLTNIKIISQNEGLNSSTQISLYGMDGEKITGYKYTSGHFDEIISKKYTFLGNIETCNLTVSARSGLVSLRAAISS